MTGATPATIALRPGADLAGFREAARGLIGLGVAPRDVIWLDGAVNGVFGLSTTARGAPVLLPKGASELIGVAVCHSDPERYALLYTLIWRLTHGEKQLLEIASDPLVHRLQAPGQIRSP